MNIANALVMKLYHRMKQKYPVDKAKGKSDKYTEL